MTAGGWDFGSAQSGSEFWHVTREQLDLLFEDIYGAQYGADAVELAHKISECEKAYNQFNAEFNIAEQARKLGEPNFGRCRDDIVDDICAKDEQLMALRQEQENLSRIAGERYRNEYLTQSDIYHAERGHASADFFDYEGIPRENIIKTGRTAEAELRTLQREITVTEQRIAHLNDVMRNPAGSGQAEQAARELEELAPRLRGMQQQALELSKYWDQRDISEFNQVEMNEWFQTSQKIERLEAQVQADDEVVSLNRSLEQTSDFWEKRGIVEARDREVERARTAQGETRTDLIARNQRARSTMEACEANRDAPFVKAKQEAENARLLAQQSEAREAKKWSCNPSRAVIVGGLVAVAAGALLFMFVPGSPLNVSGDKKSPHHSGDSAADPQDAFAASGGHIQGFHENTQGISSRDAWTGGASSGYAVNNAGMGNLAEHIAVTNQAVDGIVQTQAEQVTTGRRTVADAFDGLQLAMPASDSLYLSGPAGPAMSYSFQLAVTSSAVSTGIDTAQKMHDDSRNHAARLTELAEQYDEALRQIPSAGTASSTRTAA